MQGRQELIRTDDSTRRAATRVASCKRTGVIFLTKIVGSLYPVDQLVTPLSVRWTQHTVCTTTVRLSIPNRTVRDRIPCVER